MLWGMWSHRRETDDTIAADEVLAKVNEARAEYGRGALSTKALTEILQDLVALRCIEKTADGKRWHLREKVKIGR